MKRATDILIVSAVAVTVFVLLGYLPTPTTLFGSTAMTEPLTKPELIISAASAVMASAAVAATLWQGALARRHNQKSVTPHLRIDSKDIENGAIEISKSNRGVGPAVVHFTEFMVDGARATIHGARGLKAALTAIGLNKYPYSYSVPVKGEFIGVAESSELVTLQIPEADKAAVRAALARITIHIAYECVYGNSHCVERTPFWWENPNPPSSAQQVCRDSHKPLVVRSA